MGKIAGWLCLEQLRLTKDQPDERLAARGELRVMRSLGALSVNVID
jgi:hypothetical protein